MSPFRDIEEGVKAEAEKVKRELQVVLRAKKKLAAQCRRVTAVVDLQAQFANAAMHDAAVWNRWPFVKGVFWGSVVGLLGLLMML
jgi:hypothetical protein